MWTVGHSTTEIDTFIGILRANDIATLADIRSYPGSRHSPQFGQHELTGSLAQAGITYAHLPDLGGRRPRQDVDEARNAAWRNRSFRNYADYLSSDSFARGYAELVALTSASRTVLMCAEAVPWRCHRTIVSDVLVARGYSVIHLIGDQAKPHVLGAWGPQPRNDEGTVTYPAAATQPPLPLGGGGSAS